MRTMTTDFANWLLNEIRERGMSQSDLARAAGVTRAAISDVVNGRRMPGRVLINGVARALSIPPEQVFRVAGILPPSDGMDDEIERIVHEANKLNGQDLFTARPGGYRSGPPQGLACGQLEVVN